jgi:hypothetical protein
MHPRTYFPLAYAAVPANQLLNQVEAEWRNKIRDGAAHSGQTTGGRAFICYAREDAAQADWLRRRLEAAGIPIWLDTERLTPGQDWRVAIRRAIEDDALVFIACFSSRGLSRARSYQNEELLLAVDQLRLRSHNASWLIPVRFDDGKIPDLDIGAGRTLASLQQTDLFGSRAEENIDPSSQPSSESSTAPSRPVVFKVCGRVSRRGHAALASRLVITRRRKGCASAWENSLDHQRSIDCLQIWPVIYLPSFYVIMYCRR